MVWIVRERPPASGLPTTLHEQPDEQRQPGASSSCSSASLLDHQEPGLHLVDCLVTVARAFLVVQPINTDGVQTVRTSFEVVVEHESAHDYIPSLGTTGARGWMPSSSFKADWNSMEANVRR